VELVTDYLDGALDEARRDRFEAHLEECPDCARYLEQMRLTLRLLQIGARQTELEARAGGDDLAAGGTREPA
jgi:anti-sigma factor RsiW